MDMLVDVFTGSKTQPEQLSLVAALQDKLEIGIAVTNAGQRYLTTRARALEIGATFQPMNNSLAASLSQGGGTIK